MKDLFIVGDSHLSRFVSSLKENPKFDIIHHEFFHIFVKNGLEDRDRSFSIYKNNNQKVTLLKAWGTAWTLEFDLIKNIESLNNKNTDCYFWLGFNDVVALHQHPDVENTVRLYINKILNNFNKSNIHIIYPLKVLYIEDNHNKDYLTFCEKLKDICLEYGLNEPIDINIKYKDILSDPTQYEDRLHLSKAYYSEIINYIINESGNSIDL